MTPERMAGLVRRWVARYTAHLPDEVARRRQDELAADLHDHIAAERARGTGERRIALRVAMRMLRGVAADVAWRRARLRARSGSGSPARRSALRVAAVTALVLLVPAIGTLTSDEVAWGPGDFLLAALLLAGSGALLEVAARRPAGVAVRLATVLVGIAAMVAGEADDAPGLVGFGGLLVALTLAGVLRARRAAGG